MKAFVIAIPNNKVSQDAADRCIKSSKNFNNDFVIEKFNAITPAEVNRLLTTYKIKWNYPWEGVINDFQSGLKKSAYPTVNREARIACALSHYTLWRRCASGDGFPESYLILEHDAIFTGKIDNNKLKKSPKLIISINNPLRATRKSKEYKDKIESANADQGGVVPVPWIDDRSVPQGLPGNSAYIIKPNAAKKLVNLVNEYGLWPNDAIMCKQLIFEMGCTKKHFTQVQGTRSTTTL